MRVFDHPNLEGFRCPICGTGLDEPVVLVGIRGTERENICDARQYHLGCINLFEYSGSEQKMIAQAFRPMDEP